MKRTQVLKEMEEISLQLNTTLAGLKDGSGLDQSDRRKLLELSMLLHQKVAVLDFLENQSKESELLLHQKIQQASEKVEMPEAKLQTPEVPAKENKVEQVELKQDKMANSSHSQEIPMDQDEGPKYVQFKKIEVGLNDRFRFTNELFGQEAQEFNAAMQQLNAMNSWEEAQPYLNSLKSIYSWKEEAPITKSFISLVQRRFN